MKNTARIALASLALTLLVGCNTVEGVGQDISGGANVVRGWFGS